MSGNVVVLGASGGIGREIVTQLIARGHGVVAVARNPERLRALTERVASPERLTLLPQAVGDERGAEHLVRTLRDLPRPVTAAVSALRGRLEGGRLLDRSAADIQRLLDEEVVSQFVAAKHLLPLLAEFRGGTGRYLMLSGPMAACAWSGYGHVSIAAAALQMLTRALREEAKELQVSVQQLQIGTPVRSENNRDCACPDWVSADAVAHRVVELLEQPGTPIPIVEFGAYGASRRTPSASSIRSPS